MPHGLHKSCPLNPLPMTTPTGIVLISDNIVGKYSTYKDVLVQKDNLTMVTVVDVARLDAKMADNDSRTFLGPQPLVQAERDIIFTLLTVN